MKLAGSQMSLRSLLCLAGIALTLSTLGPVTAAAQAPIKPPAPPTEDNEKKDPPPVKPVRNDEVYRPPPPMLLLSSDMAATVELDGQQILELEKDVVEKIRIRPGEHLLQAFPKAIDGPTWKEAIKAPETGTVTAIIELEAIVEDWKKAQETEDLRFETIDGKTILDHETGLLWTRSVSPAIRWEDAITYCPKSAAGGRTGWRLPELDELSELYWPDHPAPRQETRRSEGRRTIFGRKQGEMETLPRLIFEPFDHNSVSALWVRSTEDRVSCTFLGEFGCTAEHKKRQAGVLCVQAVE